MNRIYQGKVTKVELINGNNGEPEPLLSWSNDLWQHHALFQDAVNYYLVCLLALASGHEEETRRIVALRELITTKPGPEVSTEQQQFYIWEAFRRRGATRRGLRDSVAPYFCPGKSEATPNDCFRAVLSGNPYADTEEGRKLLDRGLKQLLDKCTGASGCRNAAPEFLPRFCKPDFTGNFVEDKAAVARQADKLKLPFVVHDSATRPDSESLAGFTVHSIALPNAKKPEFCGAEALEKLKGMVAEWRKRQPNSESDWARLEDKIGKLPAEFSMSGYAATSAKGEVKFQLFAMFLYRYVEQSDFTLGLLRAATRRPKPDDKPPVPSPTPEESAGDPIRLARGTRGYVFRAFTSLPMWGGDKSGVSQWYEFDVAAFEEALKALHQVDDKGEERQKECSLKQAQHDYQRGKSAKWKGAGTSEEEQRPPVLVGDPRIARLEQLVDVELRAEYEMSEGVEVKYGLHPRTIRGFHELRKKWNAALKPGEPYSDATRQKLWIILTDYKKENAEVIGSPVLFDALVNESNWIIWREPTPDQLREWRKAAKLPDDAEFAKDPLQALTDERELLEEIERLKQPIRLTPADPEYSRRQFYFSDVANLTERGEYRHEPNQQTVIVPLALRDGGSWKQVRVRLHYSAPRLLREGLRAEKDENLGAMPWLQPMMEALGLPEPMPQDFRECPVALMPDIAASGERRILLNFPLTLDEQPLQRQLGKAARWVDFQFGGADGESYWLRWPATWLKEKPDRKKPLPKPWWESSDSFRCLSVDLGQRDAGAFALLEVTAGGEPPKPQSRKLGQAGGKVWWATVRATGMLRLPGEDAKVLRNGKWQEEFSGERGRLATREEWDEARDVCTKLGLDPSRILGDDPARRSFPELNDELLYALRRAQSRLARLQSWSSIAHKDTVEKQRERIVEQINDSEDDPLDLKPLVAKQAWDLITAKLINQLEKERVAIQCELVRIADRIQPLRGRHWEWVKRDDGSGCYVLRQTNPGSDPRPKLLAGQRGLSLKRIEQLESLRQRCQSLNRALMQTPGQPAKLGRSKRGIELPDPCPELLDRLDNLKEQRVNQTAHLILAQALGVRLRPHTNDHVARRKRDMHGEYEKFREPVDFIVIENLKYYEMTQGRSRRENVKLMKWCRRHLRDKLIQLSQKAYGLRVLEEWPADTSKFCSLTGVAGFRAVELTPDDRQDFRWRKHLERLADPERAKKLSREERAESQHVKAFFDALDHLNRDLLANCPARPKWRTLLAPVAGGPLFVPMRGKVQQADINAAINLGLRAIAAPDNPAIHLRIRSERKGEKLLVRAENLREKARWGATAHEIVIPDATSRAALLTEAHPNFFADIGRVANFDRAEIDGEHGFASGRGLWGTIKNNQKDWLRVNTLNNDRLEKAGLGRPLKEEDALP
jgi:hypothetical protein